VGRRWRSARARHGRSSASLYTVWSSSWCNVRSQLRPPGWLAGGGCCRWDLNSGHRRSRRCLKDCFDRPPCSAATVSVAPGGPLRHRVITTRPANEHASEFVDRACATPPTAPDTNGHWTWPRPRPARRARPDQSLADITGGADWKNTPLLKSRLAGGFCLCASAQGACAYANSCERCPSFHAEPSSLPIRAANASTPNRSPATPARLDHRRRTTPTAHRPTRHPDQQGPSRMTNTSTAAPARPLGGHRGDGA